ncbi:hypothetical protein AAFF_G00258380 [Aldrovandia affinis]|uniref:Uncharacterized protein n=1 Tax=Aldrovandia affinis TaxID=143900 RepID=A0AAD7STC9_9TELE|nr:hypothetical protein AAFF_G00258380 [Aldrovandia affinis]
MSSAIHYKLENNSSEEDALKNETSNLNHESKILSANLNGFLVLGNSLFSYRPSANRLPNRQVLRSAQFGEASLFCQAGSTQGQQHPCAGPSQSELSWCEARPSFCIATSSGRPAQSGSRSGQL